MQSLNIQSKLMWVLVYREIVVFNKCSNFPSGYSVIKSLCTEATLHNFEYPSERKNFGSISKLERKQIISSSIFICHENFSLIQMDQVFNLVAARKGKGEASHWSTNSLSEAIFSYYELSIDAQGRLGPPAPFLIHYEILTGLIIWRFCAGIFNFWELWVQWLCHVQMIFIFKYTSIHCLFFPLISSMIFPELWSGSFR